MRLINVNTFELKEFFGAEAPPYAILSHRWESEEVTFQDLRSEKVREMIGWKKIEGCCRVALQDGLKWAWIDSCCIDKMSSAELSEAINSMFRWYHDAELCYSYLSDVTWRGQNKYYNPFEPDYSTFRSSMWFTRGWTLQELLAPDEMRFFDKHWQQIGTKDSLREILSQVTGIKHLFNFEEASVAQKMSWAAKRVTTRLEDQAYCLLGIFGVNMPPLYGEGLGAFLRLQLEIMKTSNDESLFAWDEGTIKSNGLLARSPASFRYATEIIAMSPPLIERPPYSMTNKGLEISMNLLSWSNETWVAPLNCVRQQGDSQSKPLSIVLSRSSVLKDTNMRTQPALERIWIKQSQMLSSTRSYCYFRIKSLNLSAPDWEAKKRIILEPELGRWGSPTEDCIPLKLSNTSAAVVLHRVGMLMFMLKVSCVGKVAYATLLRVQLFGDNYLDVDVMGHLRDSKTLNGDNIITNEVKTLSKSVFNISNLTASTWKEGGAGSREIFTIILEDVKVTRSEEFK